MDLLQEVINSTFITEGEMTARFESLTKKLTGAKHAIAMTNGTAALFCCLKALNIGKGDEVIVPDMTFIATANAVLMAGATPVFCDVYRDTFCIDVEKIEILITNKTKAIIPVHLYGQSADMEKLMSLAKKYKVNVIEDAAQGVGVYFNNKHVGTFGELGMLSYYGNKTITCGEGGVILTDSDELAQICYRLKNHGRDKKGVFIHDHIGFNFAFTEMQAAIGVAQMNKLEKIIHKKKLIHNSYKEQLAAIKEIEIPYIDQRCSPVHWFSSILVENAEEISIKLAKLNIQTRRFFYPLHLQPCYKELFPLKGNFPTSNDLYLRGLSLPSSYALSNSDQVNVIEAIKNIFA